MEKKKVTKKVQASRNVSQRLIDHLVLTMKEKKRVSVEKDGETSNLENESVVKSEPFVKKSEKKHKKQQIEEIIEQTPEENVQQQDQTGENQ